MLGAYWVSLRPQQWTKNLVVFAAPLFGFAITPTVLRAGLLAFGLFCALSSSFYLINDILDIAADRHHPTKHQRPIAAGLIPVSGAWAMAIALLGGSLMIGWSNTPGLGAALTAYTLLQIAYNVRLKHIVIMDVIVIATGFVLRAVAGAAATHIVLSPWFLLCTNMLALFLAIEKRKAELQLHQVNSTDKTRPVLQRYSLDLLSRMEYTVTAGAVITYALWSSGPRVQGASTPWMMVTLPFVLHGIFRYQLLSDAQEMAHRAVDQKQQTEQPEEILLKDGPMLWTVIGWVATVFSILWLTQLGILR
jgi:4-hydroxybenzoate polyprenyltransferase